MTAEDGSSRAPDDATNASAPTGCSHTAWAAGGAGDCLPTDDAQSATFRALAWSDDDGTVEDLVPFTGGEHTEPEVASRPGFAKAPLLLLLGTTVAAVGIGGVVFSLTDTGSSPTEPQQTTQLAPASRAVSPHQSTAGPPMTAPPAAVPPAAKAPPAHTAPSGGASGSPRVTTQVTVTATAPEATQQPGPTQADTSPAPDPQAGPFPVPPAAPAPPVAPVPPEAGVPPPVPAPAAPAPNPQGGPFPVPPAAPPVLVVTPVVPDIITVAPPVPEFKP